MIKKYFKIKFPQIGIWRYEKKIPWGRNLKTKNETDKKIGQAKVDEPKTIKEKKKNKITSEMNIKVPEEQ